MSFMALIKNYSLMVRVDKLYPFIPSFIVVISIIDNPIINISCLADDSNESKSFTLNNYNCSGASKDIDFGSYKMT